MPVWEFIAADRLNWLLLRIQGVAIILKNVIEQREEEK